MKVAVILVFLGWVATALRIPPTRDEEIDTLDIWPRKSLDSTFITEDDSRCINPKGCTPQHVETWISSIGGSGTSSFIHEMQQVVPSLETNSVHDWDRVKHQPFNRIHNGNIAADMPKLKRIVYLHGNITHAVLSLNRRGFLMAQARKTHSTGSPQTMTMEQYARSSGDELLQVGKHFHSFKDQCKYDIAFLDITKKTDHIPELAAFLKVPPSEIQDHLKPWQFSEKMENLMIAQKDYQSHTEAEYVQELMEFENKNLVMLENKNLVEMPEADPYKHIPKWVVEAFEKKFADTTAELQQLGGLHIQKATCAKH